MKIKKVLILLLAPFFFNTFLACCDCQDPQLYKYTNNRLILQHVDNRGQSLEITTQGTALKEAYGIRITVEGETSAYLVPSTWSTLSRSYAFSCRCGAEIQYLPKDSITGLRIITLADFDAQHPAGTEVNDYFKLYTWNDFVNIPDFLKGSAKIFYYDEPKQIILNALLMQAPEATGEFRFKVEIDLSDGRLFSGETSTITLI